MSVWDDVSISEDSPRLNPSEWSYAPDVEMPEQKDLVANREISVTQIEVSGKIVGIRIMGINDLELNTNMHIEEDGDATLLYDKEWAAIHKSELDLILHKDSIETLMEG